MEKRIIYSLIVLLNLLILLSFVSAADVQVGPGFSGGPGVVSLGGAGTAGEKPIDGQGIKISEDGKKLIRPNEQGYNEAKQFATAQQILDIGKFNYLSTRELRKDAKNTQLNEFDKLVFEKNFGLSRNKIVGDTSLGTWSADGKSFTYSGKVFTEDEIKKANVGRLEFAPNGDTTKTKVTVNGPDGKEYTLEFDNGQLKQPGSEDTQNFGGDDDSTVGPDGPGGGNDKKTPGKGMELIQAMSQIASMLQGVMGALKDLFSNGKGDTQVSTTGDGTNVRLDNGAQATMVSKDSIRDDNKVKQVNLGQTDTKQTAEFLIDQKLNAKLKANNIFTIPSVASVVTFLNTPETTVVNNPSTIDPIAFDNSRVSSSSSITGAVISDISTAQHASFVIQDIEIEGEKFWVFMHKSFDNIEVDGKDLKLINGRNWFEFSDAKIYYPNEVLENMNFVNKISNKKDSDNYFRLEIGGDKGSYLIDGKGVLTIGDVPVDNPAIKGILIAKEREGMWKNFKIS